MFVSIDVSSTLSYRWGEYWNNTFACPDQFTWLKISFDVDAFSDIGAIIETSIDEIFLFFNVSMFKLKFGIIMYHILIFQIYMSKCLNFY